MVQPTWTRPHEHPSLGLGDTHLWLVTADQREIPQEHLDRLLSAEEHQRCVRMARAVDRNRFLAVRAALRATLGSYLQASPSSISISYSRFGKPCLEHQPDPGCPVHFNVTHSGDLALIAVSRGFALGVDLERIREGRRFESILEDFFDPSEQSWVSTHTERMRTEAFYRVWTRREAVAKAVGIGLIESFVRFDLPAPEHCGSGFSLRVPLSSETTDGPRVLWTRDLDPAPGYAGALCVQETNPTPALYRFVWDFSAL